MAVYVFHHIQTGREVKVQEEHLAEALLEVAGGGYTEAQVAMAMTLRAELRTGEPVRTARFLITPISEKAAA